MNYGDIKNSILLELDLPTGMTGDVSDLIDTKIKLLANEIIGELRPKEVLAKAGPIVITAGDDDIPLGVGGFNVTDLVIPYGVSVGTYTGYATTRDDKFIPFLSYEAWVELNSYKLGNARPRNCFTIDLDNNIIMGEFPEGSDSWDVYLWYYKEIAPYASGTTPEIPVYYHSVLVLGVVLEFPQYFKTSERLALYAQLKSRYLAAREKLFSMRTHKRKHMSMGGRTSLGGSYRSIWGRSLLSP